MTQYVLDLTGGFDGPLIWLDAYDNHVLVSSRLVGRWPTFTDAARALMKANIELERLTGRKAA